MALDKAPEVSETRPDGSCFSIRPSTAEDVPLILSFIRRLAEYEKEPDAVKATESILSQNLFGPTPYAQVVIAYYQPANQPEVPVGFALYFFNFSTWTGKPGLYLEDLFVDQAYRGLGFGKRLLVYLAQVAKGRDCGRFEWVVLDWNEPSLQFYKSLGAVAKKEWIVHRVDGKSLDDLAERM
ncbi:hypothetical protein BZG36_01883 [Bifiguratus adelaidae]|uniref:N-acetyltransferase domain-containing protein n=1 Tax=Bifiguratus adelaidae TaxID=1938954 RepID=A0A261Y4G9_9FUNG|nr:hypothetical protein BZG36_01883 [Bifiguratus adelaidae]